MIIVTYLFLCLFLSYIIISLTESDSSWSLPIGIMGVFVVLYLGYAIDKLDVTIIVMILIILMLFIMFLLSNIAKGKLTDSIKRTFSPIFVTYIVYLIVVYLLVINRPVFWDDELRFWGALPKVLWQYNGALQLKNGFQIFSVDYLPGIYVWAYFFEKLNMNYRDGVLFLSYAALAGAMILPAMKKLDKFKLIPVMLCILYFLPLVFFNSRNNDYAVFYRSLYVDPLLGLAGGCLIWSILLEPWRNKKAMCLFSFYSMVCILFKSSGIMFAVLAVICVLIHTIVYEKAFLKKFYYWVGLLFPMAIYYSWKLLLSIYDVSLEIKYSVKDFLDPSYIGEFLKALVIRGIIEPFVMPGDLSRKHVRIYKYSGLFLSFVVCMVFLVILMRIVRGHYIRKGRDPRTVKAAHIAMYLQIVVFVVGLYGLCVGPWEHGLYSYGRYICTVVQATLVFIVFSLIEIYNEIIKSIKDKGLKCLETIGLVFLVFILPIKPADLKGDLWPDYCLNDAKAISEIFTSMEREGQWTSVAFIIDTPSWDDKAWVQWAKGWYVHMINIMTYDNIDNDVQVLQDTYWTDKISFSRTGDGKIGKCILNNDQEWVNADYYLVLHGDYVETPIYKWELYKTVKTYAKTMDITYISEGSKPKEFINYH